MPLKRIGPAGKVGVIRDVAAVNLPDEAWTDCQNIRFLDGGAQMHFGQGQVYSSTPITPYHVLPVYVAGVRYWMVLGASKAYVVTAGVYTNITRQSGGVDVNYTGAQNAWTSSLLSGIPIFNPGNTSDPPQQWGLSTGARATALSNWPANTYAKSLRAYKNQLVALNMTESGTNYPFKVRFSHPADPGAVPTSWAENDPTVDSGYVDIAEGGDPIVDGGQLGDSFAIYKEASLWRMNYTGGTFVEQFTKVSSVAGAMNRNCWTDIAYGSHLILTADDVVIFDGQQVQSVLDRQMRRALFQTINADVAGLCFVFRNPFFNEAFVCFSENGSVPDKALVWNYKDGTCGFRDLPNLNHAAFGPVETGLDNTWDGDSDPWDSDTTSWNQPGFTPSSSRVMMGSNDTKLLLLDSSSTFEGTIPTSYLERKGLTLGAPEARKLVRAVRPRIKGEAGQTVNIRIGATDDPEADPMWSAATPFTLGSQVTADAFAEGRYIAVRFEGGTNAYQWRLDGYDLEYELTSAF